MEERAVLADSSCAKLTSMTSQSILPEVRGSIPHWSRTQQPGSSVSIAPDKGAGIDNARRMEKATKRREEMKKTKGQRTEAQAWHARHRTWLGKIVQREESGQSKDFEEGIWYGSHTSMTATCERSRPKQEGKDQASDTYEWLPCRWKKELSLADSSCTELSMMCHKSILPDRWCVTIHTSFIFTKYVSRLLSFENF